jgi:hypothetical protein
MGRKTKGGVLVAIVLLLVVIQLVVGFQPADTKWTGTGVPASASLRSAPVVSAEQRVRGRTGSGQTLYVKLDPAARGRLGYEIVAVGPLLVDSVLTSGRRVAVVDAATGAWDRLPYALSWFEANQEWTIGSDAGQIDYFVIRSAPGLASRGAYEFGFDEPSGAFKP